MLHLDAVAPRRGHQQHLGADSHDGPQFLAGLPFDGGFAAVVLGFHPAAGARPVRGLVRSGPFDGDQPVVVVDHGPTWLPSDYR
jgi:hypothetical protein